MNQHQSAQHTEELSPKQRLLALLKLESQDVWIVVIYSAVVGVLSLIVPVAVQALVGTLAFTNLLQPLFLLTLIVFAALSFAGVLGALKLIVVERLQQRIFVRVALETAHRLPRVRAEVFDDEHGPEIVNRFFDVLTVQKSVSALLLDGITIGLQVVIGMLVLGFYHPALLAFDIALTVAVIIIIFVVGRGGIDTAIHESKIKYKLAAWLEEIARHKRLFRSTAGAAAAASHAEKLAHSYIASRRQHFKIVFRQVSGTIMVQVLSSTALLALGGYLLVDRQLTLGQLVAAEFIVAAVTESLAKTGKLLETYYDLVAALDKTGKLSSLPLEDHESHAEISSDPLSLSCKDVVFRHNDNSPNVLRFADMDLAAGSRTALVALDGRGKTTMADLLHGTRRPTSGRLALGGIDVREMTLIDQRNHTAVISQDLEFFGATIRQNLTFGRTDISSVDLRDACAAVQLADDIEKLPAGYDTPIGTNGAPFSRSFLRRLSIARALLIDPGLIILDGNLDDFDAPLRKKVLDVLFDSRACWTLVYLTNEPDAISKRCDAVLSLAAEAG